MMSRGTVKRSYNKASLLVTLLLMSIITATLNSDQNFEATRSPLRSLRPPFPPLGTQSVLYSVNFCYAISFLSVLRQFSVTKVVFRSICVSRIRNRFIFHSMNDHGKYRFLRKYEPEVLWLRRGDIARILAFFVGRRVSSRCEQKRRHAAARQCNAFCAGERRQSILSAGSNLDGKGKEGWDINEKSFARRNSVFSKYLLLSSEVGQKE